MRCHSHAQVAQVSASHEERIVEQSRLHQLRDEVQGSVQGLRVDVDDSAKQQELQQKTLVTLPR